MSAKSAKAMENIKSLQLQDSRTVWCKNYIQALGGVALWSDEIDSETGKKKFIAWVLPEQTAYDKAVQICEKVTPGEFLRLSSEEEARILGETNFVSQLMPQTQKDKTPELSKTTQKSISQPKTQSTQSKQPSLQTPETAAAKKFQKAGEELSHRSRHFHSSSSEVDGFTLVEAGINLAGTTLQGAGLIAEVIEKGRKNAPASLNLDWNELEKAAKRMDELQHRLKDVFAVAKQGEELPLTHTQPLSKETEKEAVTYLSSHLEWMANRLRTIEELIDPDDPLAPVKLSKNLSPEAQLKECQSALLSINKRLELLEQGIKALEQRYHPMKTSTGIISCAEFIQTWEKIIESQTIAQGKQFSRGKDFRLSTTSGKVVEFKTQGQQGQVFRITDPKQETPWFEAVKLRDRWLVSVDRLIPEDIDKVLLLPQTPETAARRQKAEDLVVALKNNCSIEQWQQGGAFKWMNYQIQVSPTSEGTKQIEVFAAEKVIFSAKIAETGELQLQQNEIPLDHLKLIPSFTQPQQKPEKHKQLTSELMA